MRLILGALVCLGTQLAGAGPFEWRVLYGDGVLEMYSEGARLCIPGRPGHSFTYTVCDGGICTEPSLPVLVDPLAGDCNFDGIVGAPDYVLVGQHFGEVAP